MATVTAVIALLISVASLIFSIFQYQILHRIRVDEKATSLLRVTSELRRKAEDLKHAIGSTDDIDDCDEFLAKFNLLLEEVLQLATSTSKTSLSDLFKIEQRLLQSELEIDLLQKQVAEVRRFNEEVRSQKAAQQHHEL